MSPDPNIGVGKTRRKSVKRLKMLADQSGIISSLHPLPPEFFLRLMMIVMGIAYLLNVLFRSCSIWVPNFAGCRKVRLLLKC